MELDKIKRFTGPLVGLKPDQGVLDARFDSTVKLYPDGRIEGQTRGGAQLRSLHMTKPGEIDARAAEGKLDLDISFAVATSDDASLQGRAKVTMQEARVQRPDGAAGGFDSATLALSDLDIGRASGGEGLARTRPAEGKAEPRDRRPGCDGADVLARCGPHRSRHVEPRRAHRSLRFGG